MVLVVALVPGEVVLLIPVSATFDDFRPFLAEICGKG